MSIPTYNTRAWHDQSAEDIDAYNREYATCIRNAAAFARPTEETLIWAHLFAHTVVYGVTKRSPYDTSLPRISASAKTICGRCQGSGMTQFTWKMRGVCFACWGSGDSAHPFEDPEVSARREDGHTQATEDAFSEVRSSDVYESELDGMPVEYADFPIADVTFDNGALEEACRVCGTSPDTHATTHADHAYQLGWRVRN